MLYEHLVKWRNYEINRGTHLQAGDRIKRPKLAETLKLIAKEGPDVFYNGNITDKLVEEITKFKGIITKRDFQEYRCALHCSISGFLNIMDIVKLATYIPKDRL